MNDNNDVVLEVRNLEVEYHTDDAVIHAVNGINLKVRRGETIGLVGETGAGKTTIARSILRILPTPPAKVVGGEILFEGEDIMKKSESAMRKIRGNKISMIFQDPMTALNPIETVGFQITEAVSLHNKLKKAEAILPLVAPWLCISDALTAVGLMYCLWGIVLVAINKGALDALFYIFHNYAAYLKKGERVETEDYFDYCKKRNRRHMSYKLFFLYGGILLVTGIILVLFRV